MTDAVAPTDQSRDMRGVAFVFMAGILWSTVGLGIRLIEDAEVWHILFYRSLGLSILLYVVIRLRSRTSPFSLAFAAGWTGLIGALSLIVAYTASIYAIQTTSVANAMFLFACAPFLAAILGLVILHERVRPQTWIAIALAAVGISVMIWDKTGVSQWSGNLAALGSALGFAIFTITLRSGRAGETLPIVFLSGIIAVAGIAIYAITQGLSLQISQQDTGVALAMGCFQVGAGLVLYTLGSKTVPAVELTLLTLAEVLLAPFWVWLFLSEVPSEYTIIGGVILLVAITGNALSGKRRKPTGLPK